MKTVFADPQFSFELLRTLGHAYYSGSDIAECLHTADRIKEGDNESWYSEWNKTAELVHGQAEESLAKGHRVSAREAYLRASNYYRTAEFFLHDNPSDPRIMELWQESHEAFTRAAELFDPPFEFIEIPYEGTTLPGCLFKADGTKKQRPTMLLHTGFDGTLEELYFEGAAAAVRRGYNCLAFEGPGQGRVLRQQKLYFRHDWEKVVTPVVNYALTRPEIDGRRLVLMGISFGGYLAPRAVAFEHRIATCIANSGLFDFFSIFVPPGMERQDSLDYIVSNPADTDKMMDEMAKSNSTMRWSLADGKWKFDSGSPSGYARKAAQYTLDGVADKITCRMLVIDAEGEQFFPGQAKKLYDILTCPKDMIIFTEAEAAGEHCQVGAHSRGHQRIFDWLDEFFAGMDK